MRDAMSFALHIRQSGRGARAIQARRDKWPRSLQGCHEAEPLEDLPAVYSKLPIYYITNRMVVRGPAPRCAGRITAR